MKRRSLFATLAAAAAIASAPVSAATTSPVAVTGSVMQSCTAWTPSGSLTFAPKYDVFSSASPTGSASLATRCTKGASVTFAVNGGQNYTHASPGGFRAMTDGSSHYLSYQLYQNSGLTAAWAFSASTGTGTAVGQTGLGNAAGETMTLNLYGQVPAGQDAFVSANSKSLLYQDTVTVTVNY